MNKLALLVTGALFLSASPALALDVGNWMSFNTPRPLAVGCSDEKDALRVEKLRRLSDGGYALREFVEWVGVHYLEDDKRWRGCVILNDVPDRKWTVTKKIPLGDRSNRFWFCLQNEFDFTDYSDPRVKYSTPPCFWILMNNTPLRS